MADDQTFAISDYSGSWAARPRSAPSGTIRVGPGGKWTMQFGSKTVSGGLNRYEIRLTPVEGSTARVQLADKQDARASATFTVAAGAEFKAAWDAQLGGFMEANATGWWNDPALWASLGMLKAVILRGTSYLGGWPAYPKPVRSTSNNLSFRADGIVYNGFRELIKIPWAEVTSLEIEGPDSPSSRVTVTRLVTLGVFALAAKKNTSSVAVVVRTKDAGEVIFSSQKSSAGQLRGRLLPLTSRLNRVNGSEPDQIPAVAPAAALSVADELRKLAELRDSGILSDDEFAAQKAKLLA